MTTVIAAATGNFGTAGTWQAVDATSLLDSEAANTALTTSYVLSSTFTPGAITIDGIAVKIASRAAGSPANTISVALDLATVTVTGTEVTINVADLDPCSTSANEGGWYLFKFAAPVLLIAATAYSVKIKLSATTTAVNIYRNATAGNWSRMLRTTTTGAPVAGDTIHVIGEHTGAGTGNTLTVTMNNTATTDFGGGGAAGTIAMSVGKRGVLTYGTSASTNYYLKLSGDLVIYSGGTFNTGTTGTPMPSTSTAVLEFDPAADGDYGLNLRGGTLVGQGNPLTAVSALLNADASAAATTLTSNISTGWKSGDVIAIASTTRTATETESKALSGDATGTSLPIAAITNAHSGSSPTQAELTNLTRNVKIRSSSGTLMTYISVGTGIVSMDFDYVEVSFVGAGATWVAPKRGIEVGVLAAGSSVSVQFCSLHDTEVGGIVLTNTSVGATFSSNVLYNCNTSNIASSSPMAITAPTVTSATVVDSNIMLGGSGPSAGAAVQLLGPATFTNNTVAGFNAAGNSAGINTNFTGAIAQSGNVVHSCASRGFDIGPSAGVLPTYTSCTAWRNGSNGFFNSSSNSEVVYASCTTFGNATAGWSLGVKTTMRSCTGNGGATLVQTIGIAPGTGVLFAFDCSLGATTAHSTADVQAATNTFAMVYLFNCILASTTEVGNQTNLTHASEVRSHKNDASSTTFKAFWKNGNIVNEATIRHTASGYSWKLTPTTANAANIMANKLRLPGPTEFGTFKASVNASALVTVTIYMLKDSSYAGNTPRLVLVGGIVASVGSAGTDVTASMTDTQKTITDATNASPIVVTSNSHGYSNGDVILVAAVGGNTAANGRQVVANVSANTYELMGTTGNGAYTSGGNSNKFEQLSVTATPSESGAIEFYVDCDGTTGNVYVDDAAITQA